MPPKPTGTNPYRGKFVFKPLALPKAERKSLLPEYYYPALVSPQKPGPPAVLTGKALGKAALTVKRLPKPSPLPAAPPTLNSKPYDKPFITPYAKKRLPEIPQTDKKQS